MIEAFIIALAVVTLVAVARRQQPIRLSTSFFLVLLTGVWLWANLRSSGWREELGGQGPPEGLDPVTRGLFYRGWPLSPFMFCPRRGMRFRSGGLEGWVLIFDWIVLVVALFLAKFVCERCCHRRGGRKYKEGHS